MAGQTADAVVIGAGPNGLVAANALVDAGWDVVVLEANDEVGGAVRSAEVTAPGFVNDLFSAFYPLAAASPVIRGLDLGDHGLRWVQARDVLAHALDDGRAAVLYRDAARTAESVDAFAPGDGDAWLAHVRAVAADPRPPAGRAVHPVPPGHARPCGCCAGWGPPAPSTSPGWRCCPCAGSAASGSAARARRCCWRATRCTATSRPTRPAAACSAGCWRCSARTSASPCPRGGAQQLAPRCAAGSSPRGGEVRTGARVTVGRRVRRPRGRRAAAGRHDGHAPARRSSPTSPAPALYRDLVGPRPPAGAVRARPRRGSSGTTPRSRSTGPSTGRCPGAPTAPAAPARSTSARTPTASSTSPPT